jgi:hypothetical protein
MGIATDSLITVLEEGLLFMARVGLENTLVMVHRILFLRDTVQAVVDHIV